MWHDARQAPPPHDTRILVCDGRMVYIAEWWEVNRGSRWYLSEWYVEDNSTGNWDYAKADGTLTFPWWQPLPPLPQRGI